MRKNLWKPGNGRKEKKDGEKEKKMGKKRKA